MLEDSEGEFLQSDPVCREAPQRMRGEGDVQLVEERIIAYHGGKQANRAP